MPLAVRLHRAGGPEEMHLEEVDPGRPGPGQVLLQHTAIGLNYIDVYDRTGLYPMPFPAGLGREAAGVVLACGRGVKDFKPGDRVAYVYTQPGSYAEQRVLPASVLVKLPRAISDEQAASMMLKGLTAQYLLRRTCQVQAGDWILLYAAAGGVGLILSQWAKSLGARVIGIVGSDAKAALAKRHGCKHVLIEGRDDVVARVRALTRGAGVRVVYDSVGAATFMQSLDCLAPRGLMVSFGNASGPPAPISPMELAKRGSLFLTRPTLFAYTGKREELDAAARELFAVVKSGKVKLRIGQRYRLADVALAHRDLEARRTTGSTVLLP